MLLASNAEESEKLRERCSRLASHQLEARLLEPGEVSGLEPALKVSGDGAALLLPSDAQINGRKAAAALLDRCLEFNRQSNSSSQSGGRFHWLMDEAVSEVQPAGAGGSGEEACHCVATEKGRRVTARQVVVAAGAWSGKLLGRITGNAAWQEVFEPRRGHLLELRPPAGMPPVRHGVMEMSYTQVQAMFYCCSNCCLLRALAPRPSMPHHA